MSDTLKEIRETEMSRSQSERDLDNDLLARGDKTIDGAAAQYRKDLRWCVAEIDRLTAERESNRAEIVKLTCNLAYQSGLARGRLMKGKELEADNARLCAKIEALEKGVNANGQSS